MLLPTEYNLIFWAYGKHDPTKIVLEINEFLHQYGNNYMPKILAGKEVVLSPVSLRNELKAWGNEEGMAVGLKSLNGIVLRVTTNDKEYKHSKFPDTLRIGFDYKHLIGIEPTLIFGQLQDIFNFCLKIFLPYYGYGNKSGEINSSPERRQLRKKIDTDKVPVAIEWFNFFGPDWVQRFGGKSKLLSAPVFKAKPVEELGGVTLILQEAPFDYMNPNHISNRQKVEAYLNLEYLQQLHQKK